MDGQLSFASLDFATTKRDLSWPRWRQSCMVEAAGGDRAVLSETTSKRWATAVSVPGVEEALYGIQSMRAFCGLELGRDAIPDEATILNFRHLLERHDSPRRCWRSSLSIWRLSALLRRGTIVDATLIGASPSTKNKAERRDPEMTSSKKGNQWYFGMKAHVGVDVTSGLVHTVGVTTGTVDDAKAMDKLIREDDCAVYGDNGYARDEKRQAAEKAGVLWAVKEKAKPGCKLPLRQRAQSAFLSQGSLPRDRQERRAGVFFAGARQSLSLAILRLDC
jgi:IS5 family transposase